ncbi:MAG: hypothetical protein ACRDJE_23240, partial [Dehalococcoidia bacterium]
ITAFHRATEQAAVRVESVDVRVAATGQLVTIAPQAVIVAAGAGTKRVVRSIIGAPSPQLDAVTYTRSDMICIAAPQGILPAASFLSVQHGLISVAHVNRDHDRVVNDTSDAVTWYVTPADPNRSPDEEAPDDAHAAVNGELVAQGIKNVLMVYPALLREAERPGSPVRLAVFAGYKQNIGDQATLPLCATVGGTSNVVMALPSVLANAWANAHTALALLNDQVTPRGPSADISGGGQGVRIGAVNELTEEVAWMRWEEFIQRYSRDPR